MAYSEAQTFGFSENVQELLGKEKAALKKGGRDTGAMLATLRRLHAEAVAAVGQGAPRRPPRTAPCGQHIRTAHNIGAP